ncbi:hypothetical protein M3Y98_01043600 [Aphelenchoides besseyi]|nr:hypothetical protein M3Y98_01043600 [Aphelenchoides besseyi]
MSENKPATFTNQAKRRNSILKVRNPEASDEKHSGDDWLKTLVDETDANNMTRNKRVSFHQRIVQRFDSNGVFNQEQHWSSLSSVSTTEEMTREQKTKNEDRKALAQKKTRKSLGNDDTQNFLSGINKGSTSSANLTGQFGHRESPNETISDDNTQLLFSKPKTSETTASTAFFFEGIQQGRGSRQPSVAPERVHEDPAPLDETDKTDQLFESILHDNHPNETMPLDLSIIPPSNPTSFLQIESVNRVETFEGPTKFTMPDVIPVADQTVHQIQEEANTEDFELYASRNSLFMTTNHSVIGAEKEESQVVNDELPARMELALTLDERSLNPTLMIDDEQFCNDFNKTVDIGAEETEESEEAAKEAAQNKNHRQSHVGNRTHVVQSPVIKPQRLNDQTITSPATYVVPSPVNKPNRLEESSVTDNDSNSTLYRSNEPSRSADDTLNQSTCPPLKQLRISHDDSASTKSIAIPTSLQQTPNRSGRKSQLHVSIHEPTADLQPTPVPHSHRQILNAFSQNRFTPRPLFPEVAATPLNRRVPQTPLNFITGSALRLTGTPVHRNVNESNLIFGPVKLRCIDAINWAQEPLPPPIERKPSIYVPLPIDQRCDLNDPRSKDSDWLKAQRMVVRVINKFEGDMRLARDHIVELHAKHVQKITPLDERSMKSLEQLRQLENKYEQRWTFRNQLIEGIRKKKDEQNTKHISDIKCRLAEALKQFQSDWSLFENYPI